MDRKAECRNIRVGLQVRAAERAGTRRNRVGNYCNPGAPTVSGGLSTVLGQPAAPAPNKSGRRDSPASPILRGETAEWVCEEGRLSRGLTDTYTKAWKHPWAVDFRYVCTSSRAQPAACTASDVERQRGVCYLLC